MGSIAQRGIAYNIFMTLLMFLYIYEFNFSVFSLPTLLTSRRIAVVILVFYTFFIKRGESRINLLSSVKLINKYIFFLTGLLIFGCFLIVFIGRGTGTHITDCLIRLLLFGIVPIYCFSRVFSNVDEFMRVILYATLIQAIIIVICLINPVWSLALDNVFVVEDQAVRVERYRLGYAGGLACITAPGCLRFSMGLIACLYFCLKKKTLIYMVLFFFLGFVATMIARTGLFLSSVGLLILIWQSMRFDHVSSLKMILIILVTSFLLIFFMKYIDITEYFGFDRLLDLFYGTGGKDFKEGYFNGNDTSYPSLSDNLFVGNGIISGIGDDGVRVNVDGGYIRVFSALGFSCCLIFYLVTFGFLIKLMHCCQNKTLQNTLLYFILIILLGEFKEFTLFEQYMLCLFGSMAVICQESQKSAYHV